jgi:hypothetical protein
MKKLFLYLVLLLVIAPAAYSQNVPLPQWAKTQREASESLGEWVKQYPEAAGVLFDWDATHPGKSQEFTKWCIERNGENLGVFVKAHEDWPLVAQFIIKYQPAAENFLRWCRSHPTAAKSLVYHSGSLHWVGENLYKSYLRTEASR